VQLVCRVTFTSFRSFRDVTPACRALAQVSHYGIAQGKGMIFPKTERGPLVLIAEFLEGGYFHQSTGLDRTEQNMAVISFAKDVEYMHGRGVVHGDIQPENVLLTGKRECKISIAGAVRSHEIGLLQTPAARSIRYCAPEVNEGNDPTFASDVFSVGVLMYEALTGMPAFDAKTPALEILAQIRSDVRPDMPEYASASLAGVIQLCWDADPANRPAMSEVCETLEQEKWLVVEGADEARIREHLAKFEVPTDQTIASQAAAAARALKDAEPAEDRTAELKALKESLAALKTEFALMNAELGREKVRGAEIATELAKLKSVNQASVLSGLTAAVPTPAVPAAPPASTGSLLELNRMKLRAVGVNTAQARLLLEVRTPIFSIDEFLRAASGATQTLVILETQAGIVCGGLAAVPWPKRGANAACYAKRTFLFALGARPTRYALVAADYALYTCEQYFGFGGGIDLAVLGNGRGCYSGGATYYAGPHSLLGESGSGKNVPYARFELWRL
jgi:hypothetical protein